MRNPGGTVLITDPSAPAIEYDTFTCSHCQFVVPIAAGKQATEESSNGWCWNCASPTCPSCADRMEKHGCEIWEKQMEKMEARGRFLREAGV